MGNCLSRSLIAALFVACSGWVVAADAEAQEGAPEYRRADFGARGLGVADWVFLPPMLSVFQRPRPDYDPYGLRLGAFVLHPQMTVDGAYNSNVFAEEDNTNSDFLAAATPAFRLQSDWPVHLVGAEGAVRVVRYAEETSQDVVEGSGSLFGRLDITGDDAVFGKAGYAREVQPHGDPEDEGVVLTEFNRWLGQLGYTHEFATMNLRVNAVGQRYDYLDEADQDRDRDEVDLGTRLTYALSPRVTPFFEVGYGLQNFDDAVDDTGVDRDQTEYEAAVGANVLITEILQAELSVGVSYVDFQDSSLNSYVSPTLSGELTWNVTELTSIIAHAFRRESPTTQAGSSSRIDTGGGVRVEHELLRDLLLFAEAEYINDDFQDIDRIDNRILAGAGGEFLLNNYVMLFAQYNFEDRASNTAGRDFTQNIVLVGARFQY
jgi:hypothetical protein